MFRFFYFFSFFSARGEGSKNGWECGCDNDLSVCGQNSHNAAVSLDPDGKVIIQTATNHTDFSFQRCLQLDAGVLLQLQTSAKTTCFVPQWLTDVFQVCRCCIVIPRWFPSTRLIVKSPTDLYFNVGFFADNCKGRAECLFWSLIDFVLAVGWWKSLNEEIFITCSLVGTARKYHVITGYHNVHVKYDLNSRWTV